MHVVYYIMSNDVLELQYLSCVMFLQCVFCICAMLSVLVWLPSGVSWLTPLQCDKLITCLMLSKEGFFGM